MHRRRRPVQSSSATVPVTLMPALFDEYVDRAVPGDDLVDRGADRRGSATLQTTSSTRGMPHRRRRGRGRPRAALGDEACGEGPADAAGGSGSTFAVDDTRSRQVEVHRRSRSPGRFVGPVLGGRVPWGPCPRMVILFEHDGKGALDHGWRQRDGCGQRGRRGRDGWTGRAQRPSPRPHSSRSPTPCVPPAANAAVLLPLDVTDADAVVAARDGCSNTTADRRPRAGRGPEHPGPAVGRPVARRRPRGPRHEHHRGRDRRRRRAARARGVRRCRRRGVLLRRVVLPTGRGVAYSASKTALGSIVRTLNQQEAEHGVRATHLCPGDVATDFLDSARSRRSGAAAHAPAGGRRPHHRVRAGVAGARADRRTRALPSRSGDEHLRPGPRRDRHGGRLREFARGSRRSTDESGRLDRCEPQHRPRGRPGPGLPRAAARRSSGRHHRPRCRGVGRPRPAGGAVGGLQGPDRERASAELRELRAAVEPLAGRRGGPTRVARRVRGRTGGAARHRGRARRRRDPGPPSRLHERGHPVPRPRARPVRQRPLTPAPPGRRRGPPGAREHPTRPPRRRAPPRARAGGRRGGRGRRSRHDARESCTRTEHGPRTDLG